MPGTTRVVVGGVDTHKDVHVAAVVDPTGRVLATAGFPTGQAGYERLLTWMNSFGEVAKVGVEGTGAYGAGLTRYLQSQGLRVVDVDRPDRQARRRRGKSDTVDAEVAARAALSGEAHVVPKARDGVVESLRALRVAYCSARDHRTRVGNQIRDLVLTAPDDLRAELSPLETAERAACCAGLDLDGDSAQISAGLRLALELLGRRYLALSEEMRELEAAIDRLTAEANPALRGVKGVGPVTAATLLVAAGDNPERLTNEAAFAALCGSSPIEASSGKVVRHRLNRGGNRQANNALWRIVMVRLTCDRPTGTYVARRRAEGKSDREIVRCLKRYVAREVYRHLVAPQAVPAGADLRVARVAAGLTLAAVAAQLGTSIMKISRLERGQVHDTVLAQRFAALFALSDAEATDILPAHVA
jgi:transposase